MGEVERDRLADAGKKRLHTISVMEVATHPNSYPNRERPVIYQIDELEVEPFRDFYASLEEVDSTLITEAIQKAMLERPTTGQFYVERIMRELDQIRTERER